MRTKSITYGESREVLLGNGQAIWKKLNAEIELDQDGDTEDMAYDHAEKIIAKRFAEKETVIGELVIHNKEVDEAYEKLLFNLDAIEFREDAQAYLETTDFKFTISAKKIVENKPSKNK